MDPFWELHPLRMPRQRIRSVAGNERMRWPVCCVTLDDIHQHRPAESLVKRIIGVASAAQAFDLAKARYQGGVASIVELSQAELAKPRPR
jgi:hypothetical protein